MTNPFEGRQVRRDILAQAQCPGVTCNRTIAECSDPTHRRQGGVSAGSFTESFWERFWGGRLSGGARAVAVRGIKAGLSGAARGSVRAVRKAGRKEIPIRDWTASLSGIGADIARIPSKKKGLNRQWVGVATRLATSHGAHTSKAVVEAFRSAPPPVKEVVRGYGYDV